MLSLDAILICIGLFFLTVAAIGVIRLPDVFSRSYAAGIADTVGAFFILSGVVLYQGLTLADVQNLIDSSDTLASQSSHFPCDPTSGVAYGCASLDQGEP